MTPNEEVVSAPDHLTAPLPALPAHLLTPSDLEDSLRSGEVSLGDYIPPLSLDELAQFEDRVQRADLGDWLCKLWRAILKLVDSVVETVVDIVNTVGKAAVALLTDVLGGVGDAIGGLLDSPGGKLLLLAGGGLLLWWLLGSKDDDDANGGYVT